MATTDRFRLLRLGLLAVVALALLTSPLWAVPLGRHLTWLEVRRVEISGTRFVAPHEVLALSGIREGAYLLEERDPWEEALLSHPAIDAVDITRKPPATLHVRIHEKEAIAFLADEALQPVTGAGELLPLDPLRVPVDLPIVRGSLTDSAQALPLLRLLGETDRLTRLDPGLMEGVSEIRPAPESPDAILLVHPLGDVVLPYGASAERVAQLRAVLADVERRFPDESAEGETYSRPRIDLRFEGQVVVGPPLPREPS